MRNYIVITILLSLAGCGELAKTYLPNEIMTESENTTTPYINDKGLIDISKINMANYEGSEKQKSRNEFIGKAISMSNRECTLHKACIVSNANAWNVGTGTASILFAATASVVNHAQTASELAAAAAGTSGTQSLVNKEIYADSLGPSILRAIDVGREKKMAILANGMKNKEYTMSMALIDLRNYHDSCSLMAGLVEITKAFENRKPSSNELKQDLNLLKDQMDIIAQMKDIDPEERKKSLTNISKKYELKVLEYAGYSD